MSANPSPDEPSPTFVAETNGEPAKVEPANAVRSPTNISPHLLLRGKGIGDDDVTTIAEQLAHNHLLKKICLDCNHISDAGAEILAGGLKHANALVLHLGANQIGDAHGESDRLYAHLDLRS